MAASWGRIEARAPARAPISPPLACTPRKTQQLEQKEISAPDVWTARCGAASSCRPKEPEVDSMGAIPFCESRHSPGSGQTAAGEA